MDPKGAERHGREGRTAELAGASESNALRNPGQLLGVCFKRLYRSRSLETTAKVIAASDLSGEARHKH